MEAVKKTSLGQKTFAADHEEVDEALIRALRETVEVFRLLGLTGIRVFD